VSELRENLAAYLVMKRSLGYVANEGNHLLPSFVAFMERSGHDYVTTTQALAWANDSPGSLPVTRSQRLGVVRGFAKYLAAFDERTEVPPPELLPRRYSRLTPHIYSDAEIDALMAAASRLSPPLRAATYETLIGLLSVSGIRFGEAARLLPGDVDFGRSCLVVRAHKRSPAREVPLDASTLGELARYRELRERHPHQASPTLLVSLAGHQLTSCSADHTFAELVRDAGVVARGGRRHPRLHDCRHTFAIKTIMDWHRDGVDVDRAMPLLSKVLGHANPASTYWYLEAVPELMEVVRARAARALGGLK
jgi:integrase/recombinase XerD